MSFEEEIKDLFEQCYSASKEFVIKTGEKAKDLGERGMLMIDIKQTEAKIQKLMCRLGEEAYRALVEYDMPAIQRDDPVIEKLLVEISSQREILEKLKSDMHK